MTTVYVRIEAWASISLKRLLTRPILKPILYTDMYNILRCKPTHLCRNDGPGIQLLAFPVHTQHSWLHNTVFVRVEIFIRRVHCYLGFNKILFLQVVAQGVSRVREALNMWSGKEIKGSVSAWGGGGGGKGGLAASLAS